MKLVANFFYHKVGKDEFSNQYYVTKNGKRVVIYNGEAEASKIPSLYYSWLHYTINDFPTGEEERFFWEKGHLPNLSGTRYEFKSKFYDNFKRKYKAWRQS